MKAEGCWVLCNVETCIDATANVPVLQYFLVGYNRYFTKREYNDEDVILAPQAVEFLM